MNFVAHFRSWHDIETLRGQSCRIAANQNDRTLAVSFRVGDDTEGLRQ
jgi:hypothetical protein